MSEEVPCPHANPIMLSAKVREVFGDPRNALIRDVKRVLTECRYPAGHSNEHRSLDGHEVWRRDLDGEERAFAEELRLRLRR